MIVALLSFFDEDPELLSRCVSSVADCGVDRVFAFDGPYALYPHAVVNSPMACRKAIQQAAAVYGVPTTTITASTPFEDNEVGKRQHMFDVVLPLVGPDDWLLVVDADHFWETDDSLHSLLEGCPDTTSFASVSFTEVSLDGKPWWEPMRPLMRARSDLRMGGNHYTYVTDDGVSRILERPALGPVMDAFDLTEHVRVYHGVYDRDDDRRARQAAYYEDRHRLEIETKENSPWQGL